MNRKLVGGCFLGALLLSATAFASGSTCSDATRGKVHLDVNGDAPLGKVTARTCTVRTSPEGYRLPDPACTPGAYNPSVTIETLGDPRFKTGCLRNRSHDGPRHADTYNAYSIAKPANNKPPHMTCELDHLVPLELGGADTLDNIWPQCGPNNVPQARTYWRIKDTVETCLASMVKSGDMDLDVARRKVAQDWTQFLSACSHASTTSHHRVRRR